MSTGHDPRSLAELDAELEPDARKVLHLIASRMVAGQRKYGKLVLETDARNWRAEEREELLDAIVYRTIADVNRERLGIAYALRSVTRRCSQFLEALRGAKVPIPPDEADPDRERDWPE